MFLEISSGSGLAPIVGVEPIAKPCTSSLEIYPWPFDSLVRRAPLRAKLLYCELWQDPFSPKAIESSSDQAARSLQSSLSFDLLSENAEGRTYLQNHLQWISRSPKNGSHRLDSIGRGGAI